MKHAIIILKIILRARGFMLMGPDFAHKPDVAYPSSKLTWFPCTLYSF